MLRSTASRVLVGGLFVMGGLFTAALPAGAGTVCPGPAPVVCVNPSTAVAKKAIVQVVVKTTPNTFLAITECNHNLAAMDAAACDSNAADLGKAGGPMIGTSNAAGKIVFSYPVKINATQPVGDGTCAPGGDTCFIVAASPTTMMPLAPPAPFTTA